MGRQQPETEAGMVPLCLVTSDPRCLCLWFWEARGEVPCVPSLAPSPPLRGTKSPESFFLAVASLVHLLAVFKCESAPILAASHHGCSLSDPTLLFSHNTVRGKPGSRHASPPPRIISGQGWMDNPGWWHSCDRSQVVLKWSSGKMGLREFSGLPVTAPLPHL